MAHKSFQAPCLRLNITRWNRKYQACKEFNENYTCHNRHKRFHTSPHLYCLSHLIPMTWHDIYICMTFTENEMRWRCKIKALVVLSVINKSTLSNSGILMPTVGQWLSSDKCVVKTDQTVIHWKKEAEGTEETDTGSAGDMSDIYPASVQTDGPKNRKWIIPQGAYWLGGPRFYVGGPRPSQAHPQVCGNALIKHFELPRLWMELSKYTCLASVQYSNR